MVRTGELVRLFVGDDWAEDHHDVEVMNEQGTVLGKARLPEGMAGMARLHEMIGQRLGDDPDAAQVVVGIETDRGLWVAALVAAGYTVFGVNPLQASRSSAPGCSASSATTPTAYLEANKVQFVGNGPAWTDAGVPGQADMVAALKRYYPAAPASLTVASGWADAAFTADILERAIADGDLSHAGVLKAANQVGSLTTDGVYDSEFVTGPMSERVPLKSVTIFNYSAATPSGMAPVQTNYLPAVTSTFPLG